MERKRKGREARKGGEKGGIISKALHLKNRDRKKKGVKKGGIGS